MERRENRVKGGMAMFSPCSSVTQCSLLSYPGSVTLEKKKDKSIASSMAINVELLDLLAAYVLSNWAVFQSH